MEKSIYVTSQDKQRLEDLLAETAVSDPRQQGDWKALGDELRRAVIVEPDKVPADVITMNRLTGPSRAIVPFHNESWACWPGVINRLPA